MSQKLVLATAAIVLFGFPMHKPLAEEPPKKPEMSEQLNLGILKVDLKNCDTTDSVPTCKQGQKILVTATNSEGKIANGAKIKVVKPDGSSFMVLNDGLQNNLFLDLAGQYSFEYDNKSFVIFVERSSVLIPPQEQGTLKLSTDSCKSGETIFVDIINPKGEQLKGQWASIVSPSGEESTVIISNELNGFVPSSFGHYTFIYKNQKKVVCVKPSNDKIKSLSQSVIYDFLEESKIQFTKSYLYDNSLKMILPDIDITLYLDTCFSGELCHINPLGNRLLLNIEGAVFGSPEYNIIMKMLLKKGIFCVRNTGKQDKLFQQGNLSEGLRLKKDLKGAYTTIPHFAGFVKDGSLSKITGISLAAKIIKTEDQNELLAVFLFASNGDGDVFDGVPGSMFLIDFKEINVVSIVDFYIHDDSICPLKH